MKRMNFASGRSASTLVIADIDGDSVGASTLSAVTAASAIGGDVTVLCVGGSAEAAASCGTVDGVSKVLHAETNAYVGGETVTAAISAAHAGNPFTHVVAASSNLGKVSFGVWVGVEFLQNLSQMSKPCLFHTYFVLINANERPPPPLSPPFLALLAR